MSSASLTSSSAAGQTDGMTNAYKGPAQKKPYLAGRRQHPANSKTALNISTLSSILIIRQIAPLVNLRRVHQVRGRRLAVSRLMLMISSSSIIIHTRICLTAGFKTPPVWISRAARNGKSASRPRCFIWVCFICFVASALVAVLACSTRPRAGCSYSPRVTRWSNTLAASPISLPVVPHGVSSSTSPKVLVGRNICDYTLLASESQASTLH